MSFIRYLLDEHVDPTLRAQLVRHAPDLVVWMMATPERQNAGRLTRIFSSGVKLTSLSS